MLQYIYDVAFGTNVKILSTKSYNGTLDVEFGIYKNMLSINLAQSNTIQDWLINFKFFQKKVKLPYADKNLKVHAGYLDEWLASRKMFFNTINSITELLDASKKGLVITGKSKGGGHASLIALDLIHHFDIPDYNIYVGMIEAPKIGNAEFKKSVERHFSKIYWTQYKNDIVPMLPFGFKNPGALIKLGKTFKLFSLKNHEIGFFRKDLVMPLVYQYDKEHS